MYHYQTVILTPVQLACMPAHCDCTLSTVLPIITSHRDSADVFPHLSRYVFACLTADYLQAGMTVGYQLEHSLDSINLEFPS